MIWLDFTPQAQALYTTAFHLSARHQVIYSERLFTLGSLTFGWTHDLVYDCGKPYLERWILWFGLTLRLHKFHKGDDDRAFHDHPWWFVTFPLEPYWEQTPNKPRTLVSALRPHFRPASHQHIVQLIEERPVWTLILTGRKSNDWGFWHEEQYTPHEKWLAQREEQARVQKTGLSH